MSENKWLSKTALELGQEIRSGNITSPELVRMLFDVIRVKEPLYRSYISLFEKEAMASAGAIQKRIDAGEVMSPLAGVPVAVKDNICTKDLLTSCGSKILSNFIPSYSATAVNKLEEAGMVIVGKLNMDEFAMGSTTETSFYGETSNPWDISRVPGGSSGGAAAAVAAGEAICALGSDTGGSVRQPCSFCGVSGIKPTYGAVSRFGLVAFASSLDQIGPIGKDILDCAALLNVISGLDPKDHTSADTAKIDVAAAAAFNPAGLRVGVPSNYFSEGIDPDVALRVREAIEDFRKAGATIEEFALPIVEYAIPTYYIIACAEACSNLSRYDGIKYGLRAEGAEDLIDLYCKTRSEGFGMEVKRRIMLGNFVLSSGYYDAYYKKALQAKGLIKKAFDEAFEKYDVIIGPVAPTTALRKGESLSDPLKMYLGDIYTVLVNIVGLPAVSIPCGLDSKGLPVGLQLIGNHFSEQGLVGAAAAYQKRTEHHLQRPPEVNV
jgi:aspartyl-tRNA(Asn)/glutamyl-tRNA(Gln) amidotransferase subunit A